MSAFGSSFYNQRADEAARLAGEARLVNVRNNLLQAERAWRTMADRAGQTSRPVEALEGPRGGRGGRTMKESKGKPKKAQPPKPNASQPSLKGVGAAPPKPKK